MAYTKVYVIDEDQKVEKFRMEHGSTFAEVLGGYARRTSQRLEDLEITYNGEPLTDDLAKEAVSLNNDCVIRVESKTIIKLKIYNETGMDRDMVQMDVRIGQSFEDIKRKYAEKVGVDADSIDITSDGSYCKYYDSPKTMKLTGTKFYRVDAFKKEE